MITAVKEGFNVSGVNFLTKVNGDLLEIMLTKKLDYEVFVSEGNWINVTIHGGRVDVPRLTRRNSTRENHQYPRLPIRELGASIGTTAGEYR